MTVRCEIQRRVVAQEREHLVTLCVYHLSEVKRTAELAVVTFDGHPDVFATDAAMTVGCEIHDALVGIQGRVSHDVNRVDACNLNDRAFCESGSGTFRLHDLASRLTFLFVRATCVIHVGERFCEERHAFASFAVDAAFLVDEFRFIPDAFLILS